MPGPKLEVNPDQYSIQGSGVLKLSDTYMAPLSGVLGNDIHYSGTIFANSAMKKALNDPESTSGDLQLLEDLPYAVIFKSEKGSVDIKEGSVKIHLSELPLNIVCGDDKIFAASEWSEAIGTDFNKALKGELELSPDIRLDAVSPESILRGFSLRTDEMLTRCVLSSDRQAIYIVHSDPDNNFLSAFRFRNYEATEGQAELRDFSVLLKQPGKTFELAYNPLKNVWDISGSYVVNEHLTGKGGLTISESELKETLGISYKLPLGGKISADADFDQPKEGESGFSFGLNVEIGKSRKR